MIKRTPKYKTRLDDRTLADMIRRPIITEKATLLLENNQYVFDVDPHANKLDIKFAIEGLFDVKVRKVNTYNPPRKTRKMGRLSGYRPQVKRAIVTLAEGSSIQLFPEV
ncbi:MAG TPA: 50S ribosomal protein L23 [Coleofasciculaceae cyanobacterium]